MPGGKSLSDALYVKIGMLRVCECGKRSLDRTEFRKHLRATGHFQNTDGREEAKHLTAEEKAAKNAKGQYKNVSTK